MIYWLLLLKIMYRIIISYYTLALLDIAMHYWVLYINDGHGKTSLNNALYIYIHVFIIFNIFINFILTDMAGGQLVHFRRM